ncbi:MAG: SHOCT domain-containing protein [Gammaproteobacteria bacterium]|jgi:putative membrane protein
MDTSSFGFWAMLAFWASAIGGLVIGISWARTRGRNPVDPELQLKSLKSRLDAGEISREEYEKRVRAVEGSRHIPRDASRNP